MIAPVADATFVVSARSQRVTSLREHTETAEPVLNLYEE